MAYYPISSLFPLAKPTHCRETDQYCRDVPDLLSGTACYCRRLSTYVPHLCTFLTCTYTTCTFPRCASPTCTFPRCTFLTCTFPRCTSPTCTFSTCTYLTCTFVICTFLTCTFLTCTFSPAHRSYCCVLVLVALIYAVVASIGGIITTGSCSCFSYTRSLSAVFVSCCLGCGI